MAGLPLVTNSEGDFKVVFGTGTNDISAQTFVSSLLSLSTALNEINAGMDTGAELRIRIKATKAGSFVVDLHLMMDVVHQLKNLLTFEAAKDVAAVIAVLRGSMDLAKALKKEKPQSSTITNNIVIINVQNNNIEVAPEVWRIYNEKPDVANSINNLLDTVANDDTVDYLSLRDRQDNEIFHADKGELQEIMIGSSQSLELPKRIVTSDRTRLVITKPSFVRGTKWRMLHPLASHIGVEITDDDFLAKVESGKERFGKGDVLDVDLQTVKYWSDIYKTHIPKNWIVTHVYSHTEGSHNDAQVVINEDNDDEEEE
jgi:hypothetical protein